MWGLSLDRAVKAAGSLCVIPAAGAHVTDSLFLSIICIWLPLATPAFSQNDAL